MPKNSCSDLVQTDSKKNFRNPKPNQIHSESIRNPTKPWRIYQIHHDPSQRVPKFYYWNADPPLKKQNKTILFRGDLLLCSQHYACAWYLFCSCLKVSSNQSRTFSSCAAKEIASFPQANGCNLEALTKPRCKDVEEVRVQLLGTGEFTSFKSAILHIFILNGSQLLRFLLRAWQQAMLIRAEGC